MTNIIGTNSKKILSLASKYDAKLCLATKTKTLEEIKMANLSPAIILAENKVQEAEEKLEYYQSVCNKLHLIGPLQKNKVRKAVQIFDCIQSVDSIDLLRRIDRISSEEEKSVEILLNINISEDPKKTGFLLKDMVEVLGDITTTPLQNIHITGLFTILKYGLKEEETKSYYQSMKKLFDMLQKPFGENFTTLSMGMSNDYEIALQNGATMIRIGSGIFGNRD